MQPRRIAFIPYDTVNRNNAYPFRMRAIFSRFGTVEAFDGVKATVRRALRFKPRRYDAIVVNWVENEFIDPTSGRLSTAAAAKLFVKALLMRLASTRTIFVRHNNFPHATAIDQRAKAKRWVDRYECMFTIVLTHSGAAAAGGRHYVAHPLYARVEAPPSMAGLPADYFVAFGMMFPYKRLAELIQAFPSNRNLVVVGAVGDPDYVDRLVGMARANVIVRPGFLDEPLAQGIVSRSRGVLIVHADADVVVSGSFFYAMGLNTPVIAIETPFLKWIAARVGSDLLYVTTDIAGLCARLRTQPMVEATSKHAATIEREFGDAAIVGALAKILWTPLT